MTQEFAEQLKDIETKWQERWENAGLHQSKMDEDKEKCYVLDMFPYPSGRMHMGHGRAFSLGDAYARFKSMQGFNVMHPMGWDAFGMPAENAAIDRDTNPEEWTQKCIKSMKKEFKRLGFSLDWSREITTCEPEYYQWDQWIFLKMLEEDLAYRDSAEVNWCPKCETVLADEQVENDLCWRCDTLVENREMKQWKLGITEYADQLLQDLDKLDGWPEKVRKMQHDWIGKSEGAKIAFPLAETEDEIEVFTTRPDTIFGATFMAIAPEHKLAEEVAKENKKVSEYIEDAKQRDSAEREDKSKSGVFTGLYAKNPFTGEDIPIYVAEFILMDYGTGAIMAVPAHDQRDFEFAQEHDLNIQKVVEPESEHNFNEEAYEQDGKHINSDFLNGMAKEEAIEKIIEELESLDIGQRDVNYKLRDWLISRQRYWGTPIPVVYCDECGTVPVPESDLPVELPKDVEFTGQGNPIKSSEHFVETDCPKCGKTAERETDTMDTFINSSWYFLRYCSPNFEESPFDTEEANYWMSVDQYVGGVEHAVMHLLYARFFNKFLRDQKMIENDEPFEKLLTQGMVNHPAYKCPEHDWLYPEEVKDEDKCSECGNEVEMDVMKMSKSKNNVVRPSELVKEHGADTARTFILRASHPEKELDWSKKGVEASKDMLQRIDKIVKEKPDLITETRPETKELSLEDRIICSRIQRTKESVTENCENYEFNIAIGEIDKLLTKLYWYRQRDPKPEVFSEGVQTVVKLLSPFAPHLADELWEVLNKEEFLFESNWPKPINALIDEEAEKIDEYFDSVSSDVRDIKSMVDSEPEKLKIIQASNWKYHAFEEIKNSLDLQDVGKIMGDVLDEELKPKAQKVNQMVVKAVENPGKFQNQFLHYDTEKKALKQNAKRWREEFEITVEIETEESSKNSKASRAEPGRPAIVME